MCRVRRLVVAIVLDTSVGMPSIVAAGLLDDAAVQDMQPCVVEEVEDWFRSHRRGVAFAAGVLRPHRLLRELAKLNYPCAALAQWVHACDVVGVVAAF